MKDGLDNKGKISKINLTFTKGQVVWLDKDSYNCSKVEVVDQTSQRIFTFVKSLNGGDLWAVMSRRLTICS